MVNHKIIARESINRMSASNLALVFAPTVCRAEAATAASLAESAGLELAVEIPAAAHVLAELITHRADCFPAIQSVVTPASGTAAAAVGSGGGGGNNPFDVSDGGGDGGGGDGGGSVCPSATGASMAARSHMEAASLQRMVAHADVRCLSG